MNTVAIIPARGGSRGVPGKNIRPLAGQPLIAHTIAQARAAAGVARVVVSTDAAEIADASRAAGAEVVMRPAALAGDRSASEEALLHVLAALSAEGWTADEVVFLQCTAPFRRPGEIDAALRYFRDGRFDSLFTAVSVKPFRWRALPDGSMERLNFPVDRRPMRQDREAELIETGSFYITRASLLTDTGLRLGGRIGCWVMPPLYAFDIDTPEDFDVCEAIAPYLGSRS